MMPTLAAAARDLLNLTLTTAQLRAFDRYAAELIDWNRRVNLTAITEPEDIETRHFLDSLTCLRVMKPPLSGLRIVDVGTGAGFPGLPIKIACPAVRLTLVEATGKKTAFLHHIVDALGLENVEVIHERAETLGHAPEHRECYDWALARAVAGLPVLAEFLLPLVRLGGHCLAQKGESAAQETSAAASALKVLGGRLAGLTSVELPAVAETRYLVAIQKVAATPPAYPRRPGLPLKKPL